MLSTLIAFHLQGLPKELMRNGHTGLIKSDMTNMAAVGASTHDPLETNEREMLPLQVTTQGGFTVTVKINSYKFPGQLLRLVD